MALARRRREWLEDERLQTKIGAAPTPAQRPASAGVHIPVVMQRRQQAQVALKVGGVLPGGAAPHQHAPSLAHSADGHKQHEHHVRTTASYGSSGLFHASAACEASASNGTHWMHYNTSTGPSRSHCTNNGTNHSQLGAAARDGQTDSEQQYDAVVRKTELHPAILYPLLPHPYHAFPAQVNMTEIMRESGVKQAGQQAPREEHARGSILADPGLAEQTTNFELHLEPKRPDIDFSLKRALSKCVMFDGMAAAQLQALAATLAQANTPCPSS